MAWVVALITSLFNVLATFFVQYVSRKALVKVTVTAVFLATTVTFIAVLQALIFSISYAMPSEMNLAIGWFMPSNLPFCISVYYAATVARWLYDLKKNVYKSWTY